MFSSLTLIRVQRKYLRNVKNSNLILLPFIWNLRDNCRRFLEQGRWPMETRNITYDDDDNHEEDDQVDDDSEEIPDLVPRDEIDSNSGDDT
ncbi:predicted protein [Chaetoceros tenuissimus]|uniref:Uncharacterized protein n=1 Tax=Chaetoceros tenuissimus TaxID=426638 RepID=A0AAD3D6P9_9STRA|nr:predicted protein [Chaetoceros tenuissimus]